MIKILIAIKNGAYPNLDKIKSLHSTIGVHPSLKRKILIAAIIYKKEKVLDYLIEQLDISIDIVEQSFFVAYCITNNLKELSLLFPTLFSE